MFRLEGMVVLNLTANSFSDGGHLSNKDFLLEKLRTAKASGMTFYDVGAQSTAPGRHAVGPQVEWENIQEALPVLFAQIPERSVLSLDTYHPQVMHKFAAETAKHRPDLRPLWNDVSGIVDEEVHTFLRLYKQGLYCFCFAPPIQRREEIQNHWQKDTFLAETIVAEFKSFLSKGRSLIDSNALLQGRIWFDPLFGFGKAHEANWALWHGLTQVVQQGDNIIIGISRKRFLRGELDFQASDYLQSMMFAEFFKTHRPNDGANYVLRVHDPKLLPGLKSYLKINA